MTVELNRARCRRIVLAAAGCLIRVKLKAIAAFDVVLRGVRVRRGRTVTATDDGHLVGVGRYLGT